MGEITQESHFEMLEKLPDGNYKAKYPKVKSKSGVTFDEHLADNMAHGIPRSNASPTNPTKDNDSSQGYSMGSIWYNTTNDTAYILINSTAGGAIWEIITRETQLYYRMGTEAVGWVQGLMGVGAIVTKESNHLYLYSKGGTGDKQAAFETSAAINMSPIRKLYIDWESSGSVTPRSIFAVSEKQKIKYLNNTIDVKAVITNSSHFSRQVQELDVSGLTGAYYLGVQNVNLSTGTQSIYELKVHRIWGRS